MNYGIKICIGSIILMPFLLFGCRYFSLNQSSADVSKPVIKRTNTGIINKGNNKYYTYSKKNASKSSSKQDGVIHIGETIDGFLE